ncbi:MAG TPA: N-acetylmuramoyl-L-alanine amidase [Sphingobacterium sp.]|nr:N-acetylmuramoyl-L-alanine amidase [Sphingobacterium sp.]
MKDTVPVDIHVDTTSIQVLEEISIVDTLLTSLIDKVLTPEEKIVEQKATGIYRYADWAPAIHYDLRKPNFVILHHTSQNSIAQTVRTFQLEHTKVSAHYIIGKDGRIIQMLNDYDRGWHAGRSKWGAVTDLNAVSIGIELDNNGREQFPEEQIGSLLVLLDTLKTRYNIPRLNFIGHADVAPTRKNDPNVFFPWKHLAQHGFGIWYNEEYLLTPPANFNPVDAFKIMGYDTSNLAAVIRAFKQKFIVKEVNSILTEYDKAVLYDLYRKYY